MPCCPYIIPEGNLPQSITSEFGAIVVRFTHEMFDVFEVIVYLNPAGTPGYRNGTDSFFGLKGRPSVVRDI